MKKLLLLLILSFLSAQGLAGDCPDGSEPIKTVSADGSYYLFNCIDNIKKRNKSTTTIPFAKTSIDESSLLCNYGDTLVLGICPNSNYPSKKKIPYGAYAYGSSWKCNSGYKKSGNSCIKNIYIPPNAYASGSGWKCNSGFKKTGSNCTKKIVVPPNAYASGSGWKCNSGYLKSGNSCMIDNTVYSASSGSGFAVTDDGYVVTNYHVIDGCTNVKIHDKGNAILATLVTFDPKNDIALLKGNFKPRSYYPLSRKSPKLLTEVYVAGHPFGQEISTSVKVTKGIISSLTGIANNFSNLQIDAALQPGNSGGPIMNDKGNVVGVAVAKLDLETIVDEFGVVPENVNFGVKSNVVLNILESENIDIPEPNNNTIPTSKLGEMITDGTYYLSCWMTMAQIMNMKERKVMFSDLK